MPRVRLIHWSAQEAKGRIAALKDLGYAVSWTAMKGPSVLPGLRTPRPDVFVIDLGRLPGGGRDVALWLRKTRSTRLIPIVFAGGEKDKITRVRKSLPDAVYAPWGRIREGITRALASPPATPLVPESILAGYSGTPLPRKLGIKPGATVALSGAPKGFESTLGRLPERATIRRRATGRPDLLLWFVTSKAALARDMKRMGRLFSQGGALWIAWPKKSSGMKTDLTGSVVRRTAMASGLVDYKICAIDPTWSGLKFARRKKERA